MAKSYQDFYNAFNGKWVDLDGYYGCQCWDGAMNYMKWLYGVVINTDIHGYACDIWESRKTNGMLNYCDEVNVMQPGDIAVFRKVAGWTPYSHIAIFHSDAGGGYGYFFGCNQGGVNGAYNLCKLPYSATFDTAFRPKCFVSAQKATTSQQSKEQWIDTVVKVGDTVKSVSCAIQGVQGTCVRVNELGGLIPLAHVSESSDSKDGKVDNYLANVYARVYLDPCTVEAIDAASNRVKVHGYWVNAKPLLVKK